MSNITNNSLTRSKKIFLISGIACEPEHWKNPISELKSAFPEFEIIPLTNPGVGVYYKQSVPLTINKHIDFLKKQYELKKGEENYIVGWSMGGMIASKWSQQYPKDINGICLITSSFGSLSPFWKRLHTPIFIPIVITIFSKGYKRANGLYNCICNNALHKKQIVQEWYDIQLKHPVSALNIIRQTIACIFFGGGTFKQKHPILIMGAKHDKLVHYSCSKNISKLFKNASYVEHPTAGHDIMNDDSQWVVLELKKWINNLQNQYTQE